MAQTRQLAAIMFTDIVGYTASMGKDSVKALEYVKLNTSIQRPLVEEHNGIWLKEIGDGTLSSFSSALEAVSCAIKIQETLSDGEFQLRIGIHVGDVTKEGGEVYGDGVNIAQRVQSICDPGGIYITESVHKAIRGSEIASQSLGELNFKNVDDPVSTYAIQTAGLPQPGPSYRKIRKKRPLWLPVGAAFVLLALALLLYESIRPNVSLGLAGRTKSIAVIPMINMSNDPEQEYFVDGMTEFITTQLSKITDLRVTSRTSAFQYKGANKSVIEIGKELGVNHILEGSISTIGDRSIISIQLIDALNDHHIWAENYDLEYDDLLSIPAEIAREITKHLDIEMLPNDLARVRKRPTEVMKTYDIYLKGLAAYNQYLVRHDELYLDNAEVFFSRALESDPTLAPAFTGLANINVQKVNLFYSVEFLDSAVILANKALAIDNGDPDALLVKGRVLATQGKNKESKEALERAIALNPNSVLAYDILTYFAQQERRYDQALLYQKKAVELDPLTPSKHISLSLAYQDLDYFDQAMASAKDALVLQPDFVDGFTQLAFIQDELGDIPKALSYNLEALSYSSDDITVHMFIGINYSWLGDFSKADEHFERAIHLIREAGGGAHQIYLFFASRHAHILWETGRQEAALDSIKYRYELLKKEAESGNVWMIGPTLSSLTYHHYKMGVANIFFFGKPEEGIKWLEKAVTEYGSWFSADYALHDPFFESVRNHVGFRRVIQMEKDRVAEQRRNVEIIEKDARL